MDVFYGLSKTAQAKHLEHTLLITDFRTSPLFDKARPDGGADLTPNVFIADHLLNQKERPVN